MGRRTAWMVGLLLAAVVGACVTPETLEEEGSALEERLSSFEQAARKCAPRKLAEARAHLAFARLESGHAHAPLARRHLRTAKARADAARANSKARRCRPDADGDGIPDDEDECPKEPEDFDGDRDEDGCPDLDQDGDGIYDEEDECPKKPEDEDGYQDEDGCPDPDNDDDGVEDEVDQCPDEPEDHDGYEDVDGCPDPDNDGDGIPDDEDECPNQPEDRDGDEDEDGCPDEYEKVEVKDEEIEVHEKIYFATGKARIRSKSHDVLDQVVQVLKDHADIRVRIEGHTDSRGSASFNKKLSERRANAVKEFLVDRGISTERLIAVGYGEEVPIDTNATEEGRARNRRVEFHIIEEE